MSLWGACLHSTDDLARNAEEKQKEFSWFEAAQLFEKATSFSSKTTNLAEFWKSAGFCYSRASLQAESLETFAKRRKSAATAYKKASELFEQADYPRSKGKSEECRMLARYADSWLAPVPSEKRRILDDCLVIGKIASEAYERNHDELNYGKTCCDLLLCLIERQYIASDSKEMVSIAEAGVDYADKAINALSKLGNDNELMRAYFLTSLQSWYAANVSEQADKAQELAKRSLTFSEKALELLKEVIDPYYSAMSNWAAALCTLLFTEKAETSREYAEKMLEQGKIAKDNYLIGVAYYVLTFVNNWMMVREPDSNKQKEGHKKIIELSQNAVRHLQLVQQDFFVAQTYLFYAESYSFLARDINAVPKERQAILKKAIEVGRKGLESASRSGSPDATGSALHALSKALHFSSSFETEKNAKVPLLEEALVHRQNYNDIVKKAFPSNDWVSGVGESYAGLIKLDLARLEEDKSKKAILLQSATSNIEYGVSRCRKAIVFRPIPTLIAATGRFEEGFGEALYELYLLTEEDSLLKRAIEVYQNTAEDFKKINMPNRVAESHWRIAMSQDCLGEHNKAADNFMIAFTEYEAASRLIPDFADFYLDYASYMKAWGEIEKASFAHEHEQYSEAMEHFQKVAPILEKSKLWAYLAPNFQAWALLEHGEDLSRKEKNSESLATFKKAAELFQKAKLIFEKEVDRIITQDEKQKAIELIKACARRTEYCLARESIEAAKVDDRKGNHVESAEKYDAAASIFERMMKTSKTDIEKNEIAPLACMVRAWQRMKMADARASPELYSEASQLFSKAKEQGLEDKTNFLASGNSAVCKALQHGTLFEETREKTEFSKAKQYLETASNYYMKGGLDKASAWTTATEILLDAYNYLTDAEIESNLLNKTKMFTLAEKCLEQSAKLYGSADYVGRRDEVLKIIRKVKEKRRFVVSLGELLITPGEASTTKAIPAPSLTVEEPVGLQKFERELIQANLSSAKKDVLAAEDFCVELHVANLGKAPAFLAKIENVIPESFSLRGESDFYSIEDSSLNMKGKRLDPLKTEMVKIELRSLDKGTFEIKPKVLCVDETGHQVSCEPEPLSIVISETTIPNRINTGYRDLDLVLLGGIPEGYAVILTSPSFDERGLLIRRFLETGLKKGDMTFYVTVDVRGIEPLVEEFKTNFHLFVCNPRADEIIDNTPNVFKLKGVENLTDISIALTSAFRNLDSSTTHRRRACLEIISDVLLQHHAVSARRWLTALIPELRSRGFTTLAAMNPGMHPVQEVQAMLDVFEGEINIYEKETSKGLEKFFAVKRMSNQRYLESELHLRKKMLES